MTKITLGQSPYSRAFFAVVGKIAASVGSTSMRLRPIASNLSSGTVLNRQWR